MNPLALGGIIETVGKIAGDLVTTDKERMELAIKGQEVEQRTDLAQVEVNKVEAAHASLFISGWRPAVGWLGVFALGYQFIAYPIMVWAWAIAQNQGHIPAGVSPPPMIPSDELWVILSGILGIAGMRSVEKVRGVARG